MSGADDNKKALKLYHEWKEIMTEGGFNLRKWHSNSQELMTAVNPADGNANTSTHELIASEDDQSPPKASVAREREVHRRTRRGGWGGGRPPNFS